MLYLALFTLLFLCVVIQLGYAFYYFFPFVNYTPPTLSNPDFPVSVIVAAHNERLNLEAFLPVILSQNYPAFEVIVVDDRSEDGTEKYLENLSLCHSNLRILPIERTPPGFNPKKSALTLGIAAARYEHLLFTDADCKPLSANWIREIAAGFFAETNLVLGYSPYMNLKGFLNKLIRFETLVSAVQYLSFAGKGNSYMGVGRNLAYTKTCFYQNNGFSSHKSLMGGDDDLFVRDVAGKSTVKLVVKKEAQTVSIPKQTYQEWVKQKRRHLAIGREYNWPDKFRIGVYMLANILFYFTTFSLLFTAPAPGLILVGILFSLRCIVVYIAYSLIARKLNERLSVLFLPLLDLVYILNYVALGLSVLMFRKVRWK